MSKRVSKNQSRAKRRERQAARRQTRGPHPRTDVRFWHGGVAGLTPGTLLIGRTEAESLGQDLRYYGLNGTYQEDITNPAMVYFSSSREFARAYAAQVRVSDPQTGIIHQYGSLYEVEPIGQIEPDPDFPRDVSWCSPQARITAVAELNVPLNAYQITERLGPHTFWMDGSPTYSAAGRYLPSPEQIANMEPGVLTSMSEMIFPWTPVQFINGWLEGKPSGDRPDPAVFPNITHAAAEAGLVSSRHHERVVSLLEQGVTFRDDVRSQLAEINRLLPLAGGTVARYDDTRGIVAAVHPRDGIIGASVFTATKVHNQVVMLLDAIVVAPKWQRHGVGSVLLLTSQQILPANPSFTAGHCAPKVAPFFSQVGFTVLRPGVPLPVMFGEKALVADVGTEHSWFYRQSPI